ncbi:MAG: alpha/beta fold hydrolase [Planctomycetes bacterium]|nr:alpha/beta fold hydrolase [Planctomycetota bacterium]
MTFDPRELGDLYPWTPRRFELPGGVGMSYLDEGPRQGGETFLMLHGNPTWSFYYRGLVRALSGEHRCVAPDHVGSGLSDKPQDYPYTLGTHVDNVERLVEHLDLRDVTLVVHDWGGAIGMGWTTRHPDRVRRLVVLNTAAFRSQRIPPSIDLCRVPGLGALLIRGLNGFARAATLRAVQRKMPADVKRGYLGPYGSWADRVGNLRFVQDIPMHDRIPSWPVIVEVERRLPALRDKPMLVCWGGRDFCFDDTFLAGWRERFPEAEVHRFADAGHYVLEDAGPEVLERLRAFVARTGSPAPSVTPSVGGGEA